MEFFPRSEIIKRGLIEIENPGVFLKQGLEETPDHEYSEEELQDEEISRENLPSLLKEHRDRIGKAMEQSTEIAQAVARQYRTISEEYGFLPERIRVYLVGGRTRQQPFRLTSDLDTVITVSNQEEGLEREGKDNDRNNLRTKIKQELWNRLNPILAEYNLTEDVDGRVASFWEIKGYGRSDGQFRADCTKSAEIEAILLFDEGKK